MEKTDASRLEFKRSFLLQNIADVKREWYRHDDHSEKLRFWFLTVWFGTLAIFLKEKSSDFSLYALLLIVTLTFYALEIFYHRMSTFRIYRISIMEHWLMQATDQEIFELQGPLANVVNLKKEDVVINGWQMHIFNPNVSLLYWIFLFISIVIEPLLRLT